MVVGEYVLFSAVVFNIPEKQSFLPEHIDLARLIDSRVKEEKQEENASDLIEVKQEKKVDTLKSSPIFNSENKLNNEKSIHNKIGSLCYKQQRCEEVSAGRQARVCVYWSFKCGKIEPYKYAHTS